MASQPHPSNFTIGETGFGTGLNFLVAAHAWRECLANAGSDAGHLHYVSVEKYPLTRADIQRANTPHTAFAALLEPLLAQYPAAVRGHHRLVFPALHLTLTLIFDDATQALENVCGTVHAWFLDGFAPAKNPTMWQPALYRQLARLSAPGATLATFTAAGHVRRGLQDAGFQMTKQPGFGRKRDMLTGQLASVQACGPVPLPPPQRPWFRVSASANPAGRALVIGAGLAGAQVAASLQRRHWHVTVVDQNDEPASAASGNPSGMTFTRLSPHDSPQNRYYQSAFSNACRALRQQLEDQGVPEGVDWALNGLIQLADTEATRTAQRAMLEQPVWPEAWLQPVSASVLRAQYHIDTELDGVVLTQGGWLYPRRLIEVLLAQSNIEFLGGIRIENLQPTALNATQGWQVTSRAPLPQPLEDAVFDAVIITGGMDSAGFHQTAELPLRPVRGQITQVAATPATTRIRHAINYEGYFNPARAGQHTFGATFQPNCTDLHPRPEDHAENWKNLRSALPAIGAALDAAGPAQGRVGIRCQTPDYLPIVGPVPHADWYRLAYADLATGFLKRRFPVGQYWPGLYISVGHGSRGITSSYFAAETIASYLHGEPHLADRAVLEAIHPARFLIRDLIRKRRQQSSS